MSRWIGAALVVLSGSVAAQGKPDYAGTWIRDSVARPAVATVGDAAFRVGDMGSGWGSPLTITLRADSLVLEYVLFSSYDLQPPVRMAWEANGAESLNLVNIGHATSAERGRVSWSGDTLVVVTRHPNPPGIGSRGDATVVRHVLSLQTPGVLVITTSRMTQSTGVVSQTRTTYTRK